MATIARRSLFSWRDIDAASDLQRLKLVLSVLPDEAFMQLLEAERGKGRDDYPVRAMWNAVIAGIVFQHLSVASLVRELWRNRELLESCGFDPLQGGGGAPTQDAMERFLLRAVRHREHLMRMFDEVIEELGILLPDLGRLLAVDSKAIASYGKPIRDDVKRAQADGRRDTDANWGKKTYKGVHEDGTTWEKVVRWFGFKIHLLVDSRHEIPLAMRVTKASEHDSPHLLPLVEQYKARHGGLGTRAEELAADKAYDSGPNNAALHDDHAIKPVIDKRTMWKDGEKTRPLKADRADSFIYDEAGKVFCVCPVSGEQREMAFAGFDKDHRALKYRCPAAAYDLFCPGREQCERLACVGPFGRTLRVPLKLDRRIFTPIARHSHKWKKAYARRTAVERVNARIDRVLGFENHFIRGKAKMETRLNLSLLVLVAMALGRIRADQAELMRSMTAPVRMAA